MLTSLHVKNLALIDEEEIQFQPGLNILSGETGAGKSIILGALGLTLGQKASKGFMRDASREALVEAVFSVTNDKQREALKALEVDVYDDEVILSRKVTETRAIARINGETVPAVKMKEVGQVFLDIYGQNEHQSLLSAKKHLDMLDAFGKKEIAGLKTDMKAAYDSYTELARELETANLDESARARELSYLEHETEEIANASLKAGEDEVLETTYRKMQHSNKIVESLNEAYAYITEEQAAADLVGRALMSVRGVEQYDEKVENLASALTDADALLSDIGRDISSYMESLEYDPEEFRQTEERLDLINDLKMKYGATIEAILDQLEEKNQRMEQLQDYDAYIAKLTKDVNEARSRYDKLAAKVSALRKKYAKELTNKVADSLVDLNFLDVKFTMEFTELDHPTANGMDGAEFYISTNPGQPVRPLKEIASGGEMSRIMLAMKTVLAQKEDTIDTLIFDEIDAGISGRTAQSVSEKLHMVAGSQQVICITHLPQIAAMADAHYLIAKAVENNQTISGIHQLDEAESVEELARMLAGGAITESVMANAREMRQLAHAK